MTSPSRRPPWRLLVSRFFDVADRIGGYRLTVRIVSWVLLILLSVGIALEYGAWQRHEASAGPFRTSAAIPGQYAVDIGRAVPAWLGVRLTEIDARITPQSRLQLLQDGRSIDLPATPSPRITRSDRTPPGARRQELSFALPEGVANDARLRLHANYTVMYYRTVHDILLAWFVLMVGLRLVIARGRLARISDGASSTAIIHEHTQQPRRRFIPALPAAFPALSGLVIAACAAYAGTIVYGAAAGHALPTATAFHLMPADVLSGLEPYLPVVILLFAAAGTSLAWLAAFGVIPAEPIRETERLLSRIWAWWGLPVILCLFLISVSAGGWSGHIRVPDLNYVSLAGLAPHSDGRAYFTDAYRAAFFGDWDVLGSRRPLAEAFRQVTVLAGGYSYVWTLLVQLCLLATATFIAARFVAQRFGIWAGIAFVGLIYLVAKPFLQTTMTEPLGLLWTLFAIVFLMEAFRLNSLPHALIAFAGLTLALMTRMGSMFTIPVVALWLAWAFAPTWRGRLRLFVVACGIVISVVALNTVLAFLYASPLVASGSNFSFTFCGLSLGTNWSDCLHFYDSQLQKLPDERSRAAFLLAMAWQNIFDHPSVFLSTLLDNAMSYVKMLPRILWGGYSPGYQVSTAVARIATLLVLVSLVLTQRRRMARAEVVFWILLFLSSVLSAAIIFTDDGVRTLHVTHALLACVLAAGFSAPAVSPSYLNAWSLRWTYGAGTIAVAGFAFLIVPAISNAVMSSPLRARGEPSATEMIVPGGRFITGFQVVADGDKRSLDVPTLSVSEFVKLVRMTDLETDFGRFIDLAVRRVPFALVVTGRFDALDQSNILIAPVDVLTRPDVAAWRLQLRQGPPGGPAWNTLREVVAAEPFHR
ncbi:MAG: hypothetical protein K2Y71_13455 [Xanthobacteraceae bacterium]|nr:hypothetical protein [Xanthobacteraceae bacterium]